MVDLNIGVENFLYISLCSALGYFVDYRIFVALTSWVHYLHYIHQYYFRYATGNIALYKNWQRDVLMYKTIALANLGYIYFSPYCDSNSLFEIAKLDYVSLSIIFLGYLISVSATNALGIDGTYFGIELGFVVADYNFVHAFPYNILPHPMILGQVFALLGFFKVPQIHSLALATGGGPAGYRSGMIGLGVDSGVDGWWWLIPVHILLYFTHMFQEIYDVWKGEPWYKVVQNKNKDKDKSS